MSFSWPTWIGTPSQLGLLLAFVGSVFLAWLKVYPKILELNLTDQARKRSELYAHIDRLNAELKTCKDECDAQEVRLKEQIERLVTKVNNEERQRVQSEISLVKILIDIVPAPQLKAILDALQKKDVTLAAASITAINGPIEDANSGGKE